MTTLAPPADSDLSAASDDAGQQHESPLRRSLRTLLRQPNAVVGLVLVVLLTVAGVFGPMMVQHDPRHQQIRHAFVRPGSPGHLLGTDHLGRDILSRTLHGARISLAIGVFVSLLSAAIGVVLGGIAGYALGWFDASLMRVVDLLLAFPRLILAIAVLAVMDEPSLFLVFLVLSLTGWAGIARLVRAQVLQARELEFVQAAMALGAGHARILLVHILPHIAGVVIIWTTLSIPATIMAEAGLSFLGIGAEPETPSWGIMIAEGYADLRTEWWVSFIPGVALAFTVLGYNLLGDGLQDALNPRLRKR